MLTGNVDSGDERRMLSDTVRPQNVQALAAQSSPFGLSQCRPLDEGAASCVSFLICTQRRIGGGGSIEQKEARPAPNPVCGLHESRFARTRSRSTSLLADSRWRHDRQSAGACMQCANAESNRARFELAQTGIPYMTQQLGQSSINRRFGKRSLFPARGSCMQMCAVEEIEGPVDNR
jgi:hypothetical protein